jgi:ribose transport system substrate-binding protein
VRTETFVGSDNYEGGRLAGEYLVKVTGGKARVGILEGIPGHETGDSRLRGFRDAVKTTPGITIVASQPANWERDQGFNVFQNMLQAHGDIDSVFACSDLMALGALEAIAAAGKTGRIKVIGFDALDDAKKAIRAGTMEASVAQFPSEMGRAAVESAVRVIRGEPVPADIKVKLELVTRQLLKPVSLQMKEVSGGSALADALEAVLAAAQRPAGNEDSPRWRAGPSLGGLRRSFVTDNPK